MDKLPVARLYRDILKLAARFPSINRAQMIEEIKLEFHAGKTLTDPAEITRRRQLAVQSVKQLRDYTKLDSSSTDWDVYLRGNLQ